MLSVMLSGAVLVLLWIALSFAYGGEATTLRLVHLVYRHGARSSLHFYPNDKYQADDWPDGAGRLTQKGSSAFVNITEYVSACVWGGG